MKKRLPIIIVLLLIAGLAAWWFTSHRREVSGSTLRIYGNVDIREVNVGFRVSGRVTEVLKDEGDSVHTGDVLARLDDEPYRRELEQAKGQGEAAQAHLELLQAGYRPEEIAQARAEVKAREVAADNARRLLDRRKTLVSTKAIPEENYTDAEAAYQQAEAQLKAAQAQLSLREAGFRKEDIAQAQANLDQAEAALATAQLHVQDSVLKAPSEGVILTRAEEPGAILQAGKTVLTISLNKPVWVRAYVEEPDLGRVHPGMKVKVFTDSRPDHPYEGQIGFISPRAEFTPKNVETTELRTSLVYRLRIVIANPDEGLRQGMPVTAEIELNDAQ